MFLFTSWTALPVVESWAVNWEGKETWGDDMPVLDSLREGVPDAIVKSLPTCDVMKARHARNVYEQTPIAGKNCVEAE